MDIKKIMDLSRDRELKRAQRIEKNSAMIQIVIIIIGIIIASIIYLT